MIYFFIEPYDISKTPFRVELDDMENVQDRCEAQGFEEYQIQFDDSEEELWHADLFRLLLKVGALGPRNLEDLRTVADLHEQDAAALFWAFEQYGGGDLDDLLRKVDDCLRAGEMSVEDYAYSLVEDGCMGDLGETALQYFDYKSLARDLEMGGDVCAFTFNGSDWLMTTPHEL